MGSATFPWDQLKAESLRGVCRDVGIQGRTRDVMINFLKSVEMHGLNDALKLHNEETRISAKPATTATSSVFLTPKRNREPVISDYNTRHRDKRVRLSDPGPGASHKRVRVSKKIETKQPQTPAAAPSRSSGGLKSAMKKTPPAKPVRREIFDGVLLRKLSLAPDKKTLKDNQGGDNSTSGGDNDKLGDELNGIAPDLLDETLNGEENGLPSRRESSLADSNKENELIFTSSTEDETEQQGYDELSNTEGANQPTHRDLHDTVATIIESFDDDPDAEGEVIAEHEDGENELVAEERELELTVTVLQDGGSVSQGVDVVTNGEVEEKSGEATPDLGEMIESPNIQAYQHPDIGDLTTEDVSQIEQLLTSVIESRHTT